MSLAEVIPSVASVHAAVAVLVLFLGLSLVLGVLVALHDLIEWLANRRRA